MQYWATAMQDWQRTYAWVWDGFAQRAGEMSGMRGGHALTPEDFMRMGTRAMESWSHAMQAMPGMAPGFAMPQNLGLPGGEAQQQISACAAQAYLASMATLMRWWMRMAQTWAEYAQANAARSSAGLDASALGVLADDTRAQLRKIVEISMEEGAALQRQMTELGEQVRSIIDGAKPMSEPHRWAKAKE
jgi:hypothetical protein